MQRPLWLDIVRTLPIALASGGLVAGAIYHEEVTDFVKYGLLGGHPWEGAEPSSPRAVQLTQNRSWFTPDAPRAHNGNCGPVAALMGVRLLGRDLPGLHGGHAEADIDAARAVAGGSATEGTTSWQLRAVVEAAGVTAEDIRLSEIRAAAAGHSPVLVSGNGANDGTWYGRMQLTGERHWITVAGIDAASGAYEILDPGAGGRHGSFTVSEAELSAFTSGPGSEALKLAVKVPEEKDAPVASATPSGTTEPTPASPRVSESRSGRARHAPSR